MQTDQGLRPQQPPWKVARIMKVNIVVNKQTIFGNQPNQG